MRCDRCRATASISTCSRFNTEQICMDCDEKETRHPDYERARAAEESAVRRGDYNFPGIGKPADL